MNIKDTFIKLTTRTYPHGTEKELFHLLPSTLQEDEFANLFIKIGESDVMFTSHLDTATKALCDVVHVFEDNIIKTDGTSILGADDKAGVTIMLNMIEHNIPGLYYFFLGEEVGCIGSKKVANVQKTTKIPGINKVISFDRRALSSVITYQCSKRCCSDAFGEAIAKEFNELESTFEYKLDRNGILTDSIQFVSIYPECTNISVGYYSEHTTTERQDIEHLEKLAEVCLKVNWSELPVERDPSKVEYDDSYSSYGYGWGNTWDDDGYSRSGNYGQGGYSLTNAYSNNTGLDRTYKIKTESSHFYDELFNYISTIETNSVTNKITSVKLSEDRIKLETELIKNVFKDIELHYSRLEWDGFKLICFYEEKHRTECDRNDLLEFLPDFDYRGSLTLGDYEDSVQLS